VGKHRPCECHTHLQAWRHDNLVIANQVKGSQEITYLPSHIVFFFSLQGPTTFFFVQHFFDFFISLQIHFRLRCLTVSQENCSNDAVVHQLTFIWTKGRFSQSWDRKQPKDVTKRRMLGKAMYDIDMEWGN